MAIRAVVFDFGGVLFDWNPDYLYRKLIVDEKEREFFLSHVCNGEWNIEQDRGRSIAKANQIKQAEFPEYAEWINAFYARWPETLRGTLAEGVALMEQLEAAEIPLYGLTNWSDETFPYAWENYPLLHRFKDIVVSGRLGLIKPDPAIYQAMFERIAQAIPDLHPNELVFIDDVAKNAYAATQLGWHGIHHTSAAHTAAQLHQLGLKF
ncbi:HAD family hydrolase [Janthinobacterium sp. B9-8]|uniref:HAD family hydrolase n=1 Tax=Janthinobacterium sp. B9-8 TaxID=1236179 RepID=UPI00061D03AF|nr:HAD family phosphatase [Janthinobacterium sp. B9-8]AMC36905.1 haloacid dehalogenase [Janthinobacterium sp. B9-8]